MITRPILQNYTICVNFPEYWKQNILGAYWDLTEFQYTISLDVLKTLLRNKVRLDFAIRHMNNIAWEFCTRITIRHSGSIADIPRNIKESFAITRDDKKYSINGWKYLIPIVNHYSNRVQRKTKLMLQKPR